MYNSDSDALLLKFKKKRGVGICYCFVLTLLRWFQNINVLFRESQLPPLYSFASLLNLHLLCHSKPSVKIWGHMEFFLPRVS